ncbi:MAG: flagellar hook-basal body complex protein FliE [Terriglobia bacterium]|nr:MAG: flagellar hook-basal body complex protein FliE [Terriglobia bacterium]
MANPITPIGSLPMPGAIPAPGASSQPGAFQQLLDSAIQGIQSSQNEASLTIQKFLSGESEELHSTVLAAQKAQISFDLGLQVRNKVVDAYQEIMRMQM